MDERTEVERRDESPGQPGEMGRRALLRRGAKLAYVVPVVLAALKATPASAQAVPSGTAVVKKGVLSRQPHEVPAGMLALIAGIERSFAPACSS